MISKKKLVAILAIMITLPTLPNLKKKEVYGNNNQDYELVANSIMNSSADFAVLFDPILLEYNPIETDKRENAKESIKAGLKANEITSNAQIAQVDTAMASDEGGKNVIELDYDFLKELLVIESQDQLKVYIWDNSQTMIKEGKNVYKNIPVTYTLVTESDTTKNIKVELPDDFTTPNVIIVDKKNIAIDPIIPSPKPIIPPVNPPKPTEPEKPTNPPKPVPPVNPPELEMTAPEIPESETIAPKTEKITYKSTEKETAPLTGEKCFCEQK